MSALRTVEPASCETTLCPHTEGCTECGVALCEIHTPDSEWVPCADSSDLKHHVDCAAECPNCRAQASQDHYSEPPPHPARQRRRFNNYNRRISDE